MKRDKWETADELRKQYKSNTRKVYFDNKGTARCVLINDKGEESSAFKEIIIPKTNEYFGRRRSNNNLHLIKNITFNNAAKKESMVSLVIHWDAYIKLEQKFISAINVFKGDKIIINT